MKTRILTLLLVLCSSPVWAQRVTMELKDVSLAEALRLIDHAQQDKHLVFVFNDLENLRVSRSFRHKEASAAVHDLCKDFPILITETDDDIFIEYIKPPMHLLPNVAIAGRQIQTSTLGYTAKPNVAGLGGLDLLTSQPNITLRDGHLYLNGERVKHIYLDGIPLTDQHEVDQLTSDIIQQVRADYATGTIYITLRRPNDKGCYGFAHQELQFPQSHFSSVLTGVINARYNKTSIYDKMCNSANRQEHQVHSHTTTPIQDWLSSYKLTVESPVFDNRFSVMQDLSNRHQLGFSYYFATHTGKSSEMQTLSKDFKTFKNHSRHFDNEETFKYTGDFTDRHIQLDLLADVFTRHSVNENVSLYGAGVGTEQGEAPNMSLWKASAHVQHPLNRYFSMQYGADYTHFLVHHRPTEYFSNMDILDTQTLSDEMNVQGIMARTYVGMTFELERFKLDLGMAPQYHKYDQRQYNNDGLYVKYGPGINKDFQPSFYTHLYFVLNEEHRHTLTLNDMIEMEETPYSILVPTIRWNDALNYSVGNQYLQTPIYHVSMCHLSLWQSRLLLTLTNRHAQNEIFWFTDQNASKQSILYTKPENLLVTNHLTLQAETNLNPTEWWQLKLNAQWNLNHENGNWENVQYRGNQWQQYYACISHFKFRNHWTALLNASCLPQYTTYDRHYRTTYDVRLELTKTFLNNRFQCSVMAQPISRNRGLTRKGECFLNTYSYEEQPQTFGFRFTYNFKSRAHVQVKALEGELKYNDIKDNSL